MGEVEKQQQLGERYIQIQMAAIQWMIDLGIVKDAKEYVDEGYAEGFNLWITGALKIPKTFDWTEIRQKAMEVAGKVNSLIK